MTLSAVSKFSVLKSCIPPTLSIGKIAIAITIMPTPPNHCRSARHSKIPYEACSTSRKMVEPVVVMPDIASKIASVGESCMVERNKGKAPKRPIINQAPLVNKKASFSPKSALLVRLKASHKQIPTKLVNRPAMAKACQLSFAMTKSSAIGASIVPPSKVSKMPNILRTGAACIRCLPLNSVCFPTSY